MAENGVFLFSKVAQPVRLHPALKERNQLIRLYTCHDYTNLTTTIHTSYLGRIMPFPSDKGQDSALLSNYL